ncbi:MAG TPA: M15 family metallopeptidase [Rhodanobacteraceae bacterium]|nr:M15 family metallopeptidase [Rhodanobacteraceae bacterium]
MSAPPTTPTLDAATLRTHWRQFGIPPDYGRQRGLSRVREPRRLESIGLDIHAREQWLTPPAARAWFALQAAAAQDGIALLVVSAFRSIDYQCGIIARKQARGVSLDAILAVNAAPGYSEHHSGRALDLTSTGFPPLEETFEHSAAFTWLRAHATRYGFHLSYPRDNPHGIAYEPWHWCWRRVGHLDTHRATAGA